MSLSSNLSASFESYVETVMQTYDAVGIAVAVVDREGPVWERFFGYRD